MTNFFDKLTTKQTQRADKLAADYGKLVDDLANGREPDANQADQLLADLGKTAADLKADVARHARRAELKALVARRPEIEREIAAIDARILEANRKLAEAEAAHERTVRPLDDHRHEACRLQTEAIKAADELADSCDDPALIRERDAIDAELSKVQASIPRLRDNADVSERASKQYKQRAETEIRIDSDKRSLESLAEKYQGDAERFRAEVRTLDREASSLRKRRDAIRSKMQQA